MKLVKEKAVSSPFANAQYAKKESGVFPSVLNRWSVSGIAKFGIVFMITLLVLLYVVNGLFFSTIKRDAIESISNFNKEALNVASKVNDENSIAVYRSAKESQDNNVSAAADGVVKLAHDMVENPVELINVNMSDEQAANAVARPTVLCDFTTIVDQSSELATRCVDFNNTGVDMIQKVTVYNELADSFSAKIAWTSREKLPNLGAGNM